MKYAVRFKHIQIDDVSELIDGEFWVWRTENTRGRYGSREQRQLFDTADAAEATVWRGGVVEEVDEP